MTARVACVFSQLRIQLSSSERRQFRLCVLTRAAIGPWIRFDPLATFERQAGKARSISEADKPSTRFASVSKLGSIGAAPATHPCPSRIVGYGSI